MDFEEAERIGGAEARVEREEDGKLCSLAALAIGCLAEDAGVEDRESRSRLSLIEVKWSSDVSYCHNLGTYQGAVSIP